MARKIILGIGSLVSGIGFALVAGFLLDTLEPSGDELEAGSLERIVATGPVRVRLDAGKDQSRRERIPPTAALHEEPKKVVARVAPDAGSSFRVKVLTEAGAPIPGAAVRLFRRPAGHPLDVQILMANYMADFEQGIRSLVQKIMSLAADFVMAFPDCLKQLVPLGGSFLCLGKSSLQTGKFIQGFSQELRG